MRIKDSLIVFFLLMFVFSACKKKAGIGGKKTIDGIVTYKNGATSTFEKANAAMVHIAYGTKNATSNYNQTIVADDQGAYHFDGLNKGDYFITANYTDANGFKYSSSGYGLTVNNNKDRLTIEFKLQ